MIVLNEGYSQEEMDLAYAYGKKCQCDFCACENNGCSND